MLPGLSIALGLLVVTAGPAVRGAQDVEALDRTAATLIDQADALAASRDYKAA